MIPEMRKGEISVIAQLYEAANPHATAAQIARWTEWIVLEFPDLALVLEEDGKVIGAISGDVEGGKTAASMGSIEDIVVLEEHRGKGYGSRLLEELLRRFRARGIRRVRLGVHYRCGASLAFYYKHGFRMTQVVRDGYGPGHDYIELQQEI